MDIDEDSRRIKYIYIENKVPKNKKKLNRKMDINIVDILKSSKSVDIFDEQYDFHNGMEFSINPLSLYKL
jgi:hypothetical protein